MISTITSTQKFRAIGNIIRTNITELYVLRLRNTHDLEAFLEEVSALADKKTLLDIYNLATDEDYSFLYVKLNSKSKKICFILDLKKDRISRLIKILFNILINYFLKLFGIVVLKLSSDILSSINAGNCFIICLLLSSSSVSNSSVASLEQHL